MGARRVSITEPPRGSLFLRLCLAAVPMCASRAVGSIAVLEPSVGLAFALAQHLKQPARPLRLRELAGDAVPDALYVRDDGVFIPSHSVSTSRGVAKSGALNFQSRPRDATTLRVFSRAKSAVSHVTRTSASPTIA